MSDSARNVLHITVTEEHYPRYDPMHGTPDPMVRWLLTLTLPKRADRFEQPALTPDVILIMRGIA